MDAGRATMLVLAMLTALNWALHYYTQTVTYRLFATVASAGGGEAFVRYHKAYESRLPWSIYLPWGALSVASIAFLFVRPAGLGLAWPIILAVLNLSIAPISVLFAAPVHRAIDEENELTPRQSSALLRWNGVRLAVASTSLVTIAALALTELTTH